MGISKALSFQPDVWSTISPDSVNVDKTLQVFGWEKNMSLGKIRKLTAEVRWSMHAVFFRNGCLPLSLSLFTLYSIYSISYSIFFYILDSFLSLSLSLVAIWLCHQGFGPRVLMRWMVVPGIPHLQTSPGAAEAIMKPTRANAGDPGSGSHSAGQQPASPLMERWRTSMEARNSTETCNILKPTKPNEHRSAAQHSSPKGPSICRAASIHKHGPSSASISILGTLSFTMLHYASLCFTLLHFASLCFSVLLCASLCFTCIHSLNVIITLPRVCCKVLLRQILGQKDRQKTLWQIHRRK